MVSLIVPVYNADRYLRQCLDSLLAQTYSDIEILLVDDGSSDSSLEICEQYSKKDNRIKVFSQKNSGVGRARNSGLEKSSGEYIVFVDSDDFVQENYIEVLVESIEENAVDFCICGYNKIYSQKTNPYIFCERKQQFASKNSIFEKLQEAAYLEYWGMPWNKIFKKNIINLNKIRFSEDMSLGEDFEFVLKYVSNIEKMVLINDVLYNYRSDISTSLCNKKRKNVWKDNRKIFLIYINTYKDNGFYEQYPDVNKHIYKSIKMALNSIWNDGKAERKKVLKDIFSDPMTVKFIKASKADDVVSKFIKCFYKNINIMYLFWQIKYMVIKARTKVW